MNVVVAAELLPDRYHTEYCQEVDSVSQRSFVIAQVIDQIRDEIAGIYTCTFADDAKKGGSDPIPFEGLPKGALNDLLHLGVF